MVEVFIFDLQFLRTSSLLKQGTYVNRSIEPLHYIIMVTLKQKETGNGANDKSTKVTSSDTLFHQVTTPKNSINSYNSSTSSVISIQIMCLIYRFQIPNTMILFNFITKCSIPVSIQHGLKTLQQGDMFRLAIKLSSFISWVQILLCDSSFA